MEREIEVRLDEIDDYTRALYYPIRWKNVRLLAEGKNQLTRLKAP